MDVIKLLLVSCLGSTILSSSCSFAQSVDSSLTTPEPFVIAQAEEVTQASIAKKIHVKLAQLIPIETAEDVDELYMAVTGYPSHGKPFHFRVPEFPVHWHSSEAEHIKELNVWQGKLPEGEKVSLVFSLIEHDAPPLFMDDLIGTARLLIKNQNGKIVTSWHIPNHDKEKPELVTVEGVHAHMFDLAGAQARYQMKLSMSYEDDSDSLSAKT